MILTLEKAINRALESNRAFLGSRQVVIKSEFSLEIEEGNFDLGITPEGFFGLARNGSHGTDPSFGTGLEVTKLFKCGTRIALGPSFERRNEHWHSFLDGTITQPLLRGFGEEYTMSGIYGAEYAVRGSRRTLYTSQISLILRTISAMYEVIKQTETVKLDEESFERLKGFKNAAQLKEKIALANAQDVYRADIELRHAEDHLTSARDRLQDAQDIVRDLLALPFNMPIQIEIPVTYQPLEIEGEKAVEIALSNRIEIDQSEDQLNENIRLARQAKNKALPQLDLVLHYSNLGDDPYFADSWFGKRRNVWDIGFATSADLFSSSNDLVYQQSLLGIKTAQWQLEQSKANVTLEVKRALRSLDRSRKLIQIQEFQIQTASAELKLAQVKFNRGLADNFNVIQAEKNLRAAQTAYINSVIDHIVGQYQLIAAMGILADKPNIY